MKGKNNVQEQNAATEEKFTHSAKKPISLVGPLKSAGGAQRESRDMSEGLEKSRSHKLGGLVSIQDHQADTQSQNDFRALKFQQQNMTVDSGQQPTASGTKYSKHDMSGIIATDMNNAHNLSHSDLGNY